MIDSNDLLGEMFGAGRLDEAVRRLEGDHMAFLDSLFAEVRHYLDGQPLFDD